MEIVPTGLLELLFNPAGPPKPQETKNLETKNSNKQSRFFREPPQPPYAHMLIVVDFVSLLVGYN